MNVYQQAIGDLERDRTVLMTRVGRIDSALEHLRAVAGESGTAGPRQTDRQTDKLRPPRVKPPAQRRGFDDEEIGAHENGRRQKILACLKSGPLATRDLAKAIGVDKGLTKMALQRMKKVGLLTSVGVRAGSKWALPGKSPAKEVP